MADNPNHQPNIERVRDLLSPYLDGEVTNEERALVEQAVATSSELRDELETLRQTVALVAALPRVPAPRPFTLSEADVQAVPAPRKYFGLPAWASGLAMLAAMLVCVLAAGGLFLRGQLGGGMMQPAAEIAQYAAEEPAAEETQEEAVSAEKVAETVEVEKEVEKEVVLETAPAEELAAEVPKEEADLAEAPPEEEPAAEEPAAEEEIAEAEPTITGEMAESEEAVANGATDDTASRIGEAETSDEADAGRGADAERPADTGEAVTATPPPLPTPTAAVAPAVPATEIAEGKAISEAESEAEQPVAAEAAPPPAPATQQQEQGLEQKEIGPRRVEIKNQKLSIIPGLIQIEGTIEAIPGSTLAATIQRNDASFDNWAAPVSLQTVVQAGGQFSFNIRANAAQTNRDLFALEPANYQITITSIDTDAPVIASIFFDTFGPVAATAQPSATTPPPSPTPSPSPTAVARLTFVPSATPAVRATEVVTPSIEETSPKISMWIAAGIGVVAVGALVIAGLIVWFIIRSRKQRL